MKKLTTLFTISVLSTTLALAGCKKSRDQENKDPGAPAPAQKTTDPTAPTTPTPTAPTTPSANAPTTPTTPPTTEPAKVDDKAAPAAAAADLPAECATYKATVDKLQTCDKLDAKTREAAKADFDKAAALAAKSKDDAVKMCKSNNESITKLGQQTCAWK